MGNRETSFNETIMNCTALPCKSIISSRKRKRNGQMYYNEVIHRLSVHLLFFFNTGCPAFHDREPHLSNNASVVIRLWPQYGSRIINMQGDLKPSPLPRQRGWPSTSVNYLCQPCCQHNVKHAAARRGGERMWERQRMSREGESLERHERQAAGGGTGSIISQRSRGRSETAQNIFEHLHFGSSLQRGEHLANLFKEKQITPEVKGHWGTLVKTFYVSLHCSLSSVFEDRFLYNNILNQSLNSLSSRSSLLPVDRVEMT